MTPKEPVLLSSSALPEGASHRFCGAGAAGSSGHIQGGWGYPSSATQGVFMQLFIEMQIFASKNEIVADMGLFLIVL